LILKRLCRQRGVAWAEVICLEDLGDGQSYGEVRVIRPLK
jgi:hypothetical protein